MTRKNKNSILSESSLGAQVAKPLFSVKLPAIPKRASTPAHPSCAWLPKKKRRVHGGKGIRGRRQNDGGGEGQGTRENPYARFEEEVGFRAGEGTNDAPIEVTEDVRLLQDDATGDHDFNVGDPMEFVTNTLEQDEEVYPAGMASALRDAMAGGFEAFNGGRGPPTLGMTPFNYSPAQTGTSRYQTPALPTHDQSHPVFEQLVSQDEVETQGRVTIRRSCVVVFKLSSHAQFAVSSYIQLRNQKQIGSVDNTDDVSGDSGPGLKEYPPPKPTVELTIPTIKLLAGWEDQWWVTKVMKDVEADANLSAQGQGTELLAAEDAAAATHNQDAMGDGTMGEEIPAEASPRIAMTLDEIDDLLAFTSDYVAPDEEARVHIEHGHDLDSLFFPSQDDEVLANSPDFVAETSQLTECGLSDDIALEPAENAFPALSLPLAEAEEELDLNAPTGQEEYQDSLYGDATVTEDPVSIEEPEPGTPGAEDLDEEWLDNNENLDNLPYFLAPVIRREAQTLIDAAERSDNLNALSTIHGRLTEVAKELGLNTEVGQEAERLQVTSQGESAIGSVDFPEPEAPSQ